VNGVAQRFSTIRLPGTRDLVAPDGSDVRLLQLAAGSMAHFGEPA
jgi:hypothetical protein